MVDKFGMENEKSLPKVLTFLGIGAISLYLSLSFYFAAEVGNLLNQDAPKDLNGLRDSLYFYILTSIIVCTFLSYLWLSMYLTAKKHIIEKQKLELSLQSGKKENQQTLPFKESA